MNKTDCIHWEKKRSKKGCKLFFRSQCRFPNCGEFKTKDGKDYRDLPKGDKNERCEVSYWKNNYERELAVAKKSKSSRWIQLAQDKKNNYDIEVKTRKWLKGKSEELIRQRMDELDRGDRFEGYEYKILDDFLRKKRT